MHKISKLLPNFFEIASFIKLSLRGKKLWRNKTSRSPGRNAARLCACSDRQSPGQKRHWSLHKFCNKLYWQRAQTCRTRYESPVKPERISPLISFELGAKRPTELHAKKPPKKPEGVFKENRYECHKAKVKLYHQDRHVCKSYTSFRAKYSIYDYLFFLKQKVN